MALLLWALFAFVVPSFVQVLNLVDVFAFPLGYFMAAQGVLIAFVIIGVLSARWQDRREARRTSGRLTCRSTGTARRRPAHAVD